ncbi:MAG: hypothetical protein KatS3mg002_0481 [Candidatus Woesearchaeota archaeon]|nr:MAG: hypothetical protein KatS3mg002_0481 [Candidatus Woesearchaeota archaeon]
MRNISKLGLMNFKKKGFMNDAVLGIIAVLIVIILSTAIYKFFQTTKEKMEVQNCRNSIAAHSILAKTSQGEIFTDIKCRTRELTIDAKNHYKAKKTIAEDMRRCWYEWQKGNAQLFKGEGIFCHICSIYDFKQKDEKIEKFQTFLMTENIDIRSIYPEDTQKITYSQYFQGFTTEKLEEIKDKPVKIEFRDTVIIDSSKKYATIFVYVSGKTELQEFMEGGARTGIFVAGASVAGVGALLLMAGPPGWVADAILLIGIGVTTVIQAFTFEEPQWMSFIQFMEYNATQISELGCQYLEANQMSNQKP